MQQKKDVMDKRGRGKRRETNSAKTATKIQPLIGRVEGRMVCCGKANCKCAKGELHGPYFVRRWEVRGNRCTKYVKKGDVQRVLYGISENRRQIAMNRAAMQAFNDEVKRYRERLRYQYQTIYKVRL